MCSHVVTSLYIIVQVRCSIFYFSLQEDTVLRLLWLPVEHLPRLSFITCSFLSAKFLCIMLSVQMDALYVDSVMHTMCAVSVAEADLELW